MGIRLLATGKALPARELKNVQMEEMVDTDHEWIVSRTGIESRHIAEEESSLDLICRAAQEAFGASERALQAETAEQIKNSIDLVIVATLTPDQLVPSMGAMVKKELGLPNAIAFDVNAACSGFIYAVWLARSIMNTDVSVKRALVVGSEVLSQVTNWEDRNTCVLFGDGAGVAIFEANDQAVGIIDCKIKNYDDNNNALFCGMQYLANPFSKRPEPKMLIEMDGKKVFKFAVSAISEVIDEILMRTGKSLDEIKYIVPHQANLRIIANVAQKYNQPIEKFQINIQNTGNTSAASVPMALHDLMAEGKTGKGDLVLMIGFGGGLSAGAVLMEV